MINIGRQNEVGEIFKTFGAGIRNKIIFGAEEIFTEKFKTFGAGKLYNFWSRNCGGAFHFTIQFYFIPKYYPPEKFFSTLRREPKIFN